MLFDDSYQTIKNISEGVFRDKGSKFIAYAYPITSLDDSKTILSKLRNEHPKARHFCWALRLSPDRSIFKLNDDGEPAGTAGRPILNALLSADLTNIMVVVVRYFGGTLLGVTGLINAYKTATIEALQAHNTIVKTVNDIYRLNFGYLQMNAVMRVVKEEQLNVLEQQFDTSCILEFEVRKSQLTTVLGKLEKIEDLSINYIKTV